MEPTDQQNPAVPERTIAHPLRREVDRAPVNAPDPAFEEAPAVALEETPAVEIEIVEETPLPPPVLDDPSLPYTVSRWHDLPNYECRQCAYSTVNGENDILLHLAQVHGPQPVELMQAAGITLYDQWGHELPRSGGAD